MEIIRRRNEIGASMSAGKAFADDGGGRDEVGEAFVAAEMRGGRGAEEGGWLWGRGGWRRGCTACCCGGAAAPEGQAR